MTLPADIERGLMRLACWAETRDPEELGIDLHTQAGRAGWQDVLEATSWIYATVHPDPERTDRQPSLPFEGDTL